jgi:hypothetical protein
MKNREEYASFLEKINAPVFYGLQWLDAVAPGAWDVELFRDANGVVTAAMPYVHEQKWGMKRLVAPVYTPYLGPVISPTSDKLTTSYKRGMEQVEKIITFCAPFSEVSFRLSPGFEHWLPFRWAGFSLNPRLTYQISPAAEAVLWDNLDAKVRTDVRKAQEKSALQISSTISTEEIFQLYSKVFERNGGELPMSRPWFEHFDSRLRPSGVARALAARTESGELAAMVYLVQDERRCYLFLTGIAPEHKKTSALTLLIWQAILETTKHGKVFDFEGSILPAVENFFRGFGGTQVPFFEVRKTNHRLLRFARKLRESFR